MPAPWGVLMSFVCFGDAENSFSASRTSGYIDLRSKHSIFVHCTSFGDYASIGSRGVRAILAKIPVNVAYGSVLRYRYSGSHWRYISISNRSIRMLQFELRDARNRLIDLKGGHWSMTIVFAPKPK